MDDLAIVIFSCDKNEELWPIFYKCLNKYWANHPKAYLLTETIPCSLFETINYDFDVEEEKPIYEEDSSNYVDNTNNDSFDPNSFNVHINEDLVEEVNEEEEVI